MRKSPPSGRCVTHVYLTYVAIGNQSAMGPGKGPNRVQGPPWARAQEGPGGAREGPGKAREKPRNRISGLGFGVLDWGSDLWTGGRVSGLGSVSWVGDWGLALRFDRLRDRTLFALDRAKGLPWCTRCDCVTVIVLLAVILALQARPAQHAHTGFPQRTAGNGNGRAQGPRVGCYRRLQGPLGAPIGALWGPFVRSNWDSLCCCCCLVQVRAEDSL